MLNLLVFIYIVQESLFLPAWCISFSKFPMSRYLLTNFHTNRANFTGFKNVGEERKVLTQLHLKLLRAQESPPLLNFNSDCTKIKFSIKDVFSKCDQIRIFLRIWSHLLKKSVMENFIFVQCGLLKSVILLTFSKSLNLIVS